MHITSIKKKEKKKMKTETKKIFDAYLKMFEKNSDIVIKNCVTWLKDTFEQTHAKGLILGMSGGLDCSVAARMAQLADIPLQLVMLPNGPSMDHGARNDSLLLSETFNMMIKEINISSLVSNLVTTTDASGMAAANVAPLIRMSVLSTLGQQMNYLLLGTGNRTEISMGYFTKRGDGQSDLNPLGDFTKSEIRILAKALDIPKSIIDKAPSADLWEGQTDEDEMGVSIKDIDLLLFSLQEGIDSGLDPMTENKILQTMKNTMHKRRPIPIFEYRD